ncbi:MAG: tocopherol cyclase family protein [Thermoplasmatota archaeon]
MGKLRRLMDPPVFQGTMKERNYFEGWYLKNVSRDLGNVISFIPGISLSERSHSFIQFINGTSGSTHYFEFPKEEFEPHPDRFEVSIGNNRFSMQGVKIDLERGGHKIQGELKYRNPSPFPKAFLSPGIMGWYTFVPRMECYHGVVSMDHSVTGSVEVDGLEMNFDGGKGYIEKDWGRSFPESWIWLQCNNFDMEGTSMMLSVAKIPWMGRFFVGFLSFIKTGGRVRKFATYTGARITKAELNGNVLEVALEDRKHSLRIRAVQLSSGELAAPVKGDMTRRIKESVDSEVTIELREKNGGVLVRTFGRRAGLEIMGDIISLI